MNQVEQVQTVYMLPVRLSQDRMFVEDMQCRSRYATLINRSSSLVYTDTRFADIDDEGFDNL